eukprot:CFRG1888T1
MSELSKEETTNASSTESSITHSEENIPKLNVSVESKVISEQDAVVVPASQSDPTNEFATTEAIKTIEVEDNQFDLSKNGYGRLYRKLKEVQDAALGKALTCCSWSRMKKCFDDVDNEQEDFLIEVFDRMKTFLTQSMKEEFDLIVEETDLKSKLDHLGVLIDRSNAEQNDSLPPNAKRRRYSPGADTIVRSHIIPVKRKQVQELKDELEKLRIITTRMEEERESDRERVESLFSEIHKNSESLTKASEACEGIDKAAMHSTLRKLTSL